MEKTNVEMWWSEVDHLDKIFYLLFVKFEEWAEDMSLGAVVKASKGDGYVWAVRGGYPNGLAENVEEAKIQCERCLIENYLEKGLLPKLVNFISPN